MNKIMCFVIVSFFLCSCNMGIKTITGNGNVKDERREIPAIHTIDISGSIDVDIEGGEDYVVTVHDDENIIPYIVTKVKDGVLSIYYKEGTFINNDEAKVIIRVPSVEKIISSGSADINGEKILSNLNQISIVLSGSGDVKLKVDAPNINLVSLGSGDIKLSGQTKNFICKVKGSGDIQCFKLQSENTFVTVSGSSDIDVFASVNLTVNSSGSGLVSYLGNPLNPKITVTGSGAVESQN